MHFISFNVFIQFDPHSVDCYFFYRFLNLFYFQFSFLIIFFHLAFILDLVFIVLIAICFFILF